MRGDEIPCTREWWDGEGIGGWELRWAGAYGAGTEGCGVQQEGGARGMRGGAGREGGVNMEGRAYMRGGKPRGAAWAGAGGELAGRAGERLRRDVATMGIGLRMWMGKGLDWGRGCIGRLAWWSGGWWDGWGGRGRAGRGAVCNGWGLHSGRGGVGWGEVGEATGMGRARWHAGASGRTPIQRVGLLPVTRVGGANRTGGAGMMGDTHRLHQQR